MCGIFGVTGVDDPVSALIEGLRSLEYRGYDSAGIALVDNSSRLYLTRSADYRRSVEELELLTSNAPRAKTAGIGHTRWATHGAPTESNAHPHKDCTGSVAVVHNGIIENHRELRGALSARGHRFDSQTDTEVVAHFIESELEGGADLREAVRKTMSTVQGDLAIAVIAESEPNTIVVARRTSPLIVGLTKSAGLVASDIAALIGATRDLYVVNDNEIVSVRPGVVAACDLNGTDVELQPLSVTWDVSAARKDGYADYMIKEMHEQPSAIERTLRGRFSPDGTTNIEELEVTPDRLAAFSRVLLIGCGSSYHACLAGRQSIETLARIPAEADIASEFRYRRAVFGPETLVIAVSQSGETVDALHAIREARARGATVITVTNVVDSVMARESDGVSYTRAGPEICVASTKSHVAQLALLQALALHLAQARQAISGSDARTFAGQLWSVAQLVQMAVDRLPFYADIARKFTAAENVFFLGRQSGLPIAMEAALKLKELAYVRAEAFAAGELKHGPISLIEPGVVVVAVATRGATWERVAANIEEVRARGATVVAIADDEDCETEGLVDAVLAVPHAEELLTPLVAAVATQCFAHTIATARGNDVDRPRNLAKVVTVE